MKRKYDSPEFEFKRLQMESLMSGITGSDPGDGGHGGDGGEGGFGDGNG